MKILFEVDADVLGQPEIESVWAQEVEDGYQIDNIPFYVREIALGDVVNARADENGLLWFTGLVRASGHSTVRLWFANEHDVQPKREALRSRGCPSELSSLPRLVAVDVPPDIPYEALKAELDADEKAGLLEYEEGCLGFL